MHFHSNEMCLYYDPSTRTGKKIRSYVTSFTKHINDFDLNKAQITTTIWENTEVLKLDNSPAVDN